MSFEQTPTLQDQDAEIRINVEAMARIEISDTEYIMKKLRKETGDVRLKRILIETATTKIASAYQLFMKACDYNRDACKSAEIENLTKIGSWFDDLRTKANKKHRKGKDPTALGQVGHAREEMFHNGLTFLNRSLRYSFAQIDGRGFVGIRLKLGGRLKIKGTHDFIATETEFAITSEGVFEIFNPGCFDEQWRLLEMPFEIQVSSEDLWVEVLEESVVQLKELWHKVSQKMEKGDGNHSFAFLNEGGHINLLEKSADGRNQTYGLADSGSLVVRGTLTLDPLDQNQIQLGTQSLRSGD